MKINLYKLKSHFKGLLFIFAILIIILLFFYNYQVVSELRSESRQILLFYARLYASAASAESTTNLNFIFDEIILRTNFPIVLTDADGNPNAWKGIGIDPEDHSPHTVQRVQSMVKVMGKEAEPIPLKYEDILIGYLYYGDSKLIKELQLLPYAGLTIVGLFVLIGFLGVRSIQRSEQQFIWVGMSKETAHQIGTPLSSIMGWLEILKAKAADRGVQKTLCEMEKDVERLNKITARFSQIGSKANLKETQVTGILSEVTRYFQRRLPQWGKKVDIELDYTVEPSVLLNKELFEWVIENLLKNALDAIEKETGKIRINLGEVKNGRHKIFIDISDTGRGIEAANKKNVFKPGFSTKKRGWGLGLSLAKRIIEEYHGGKLLVKESRLKRGTTMRILL
ncbi:MAG: ATP-binding protein [bacterium]